MTFLTVITPLDLGRRSRSLLKRVAALASAVSDEGWQFVIGHADRQLPCDAKLRRELESIDNVRIASDHVGDGRSNLARLRNIAAAQAEGEILLLLDADIFPDLELFRSLSEQVAAGAPLAMAPCLYLSPSGTSQISKDARKSHILGPTLNFSPDLAMHWAMPSSVVALRRADYMEVGGFHEHYEGHGYEDHDFLLRYALAKRVVAPDVSLLIDRPYRAPLLSEGFRAALGQLCVGNLLDGHVAFHLFHDRDSADPYYRCRFDNAALFQSRFKELRNARIAEGVAPPMISTFYDECRKRRIEPADFYALFDARPRFMLRRKPLYFRLWRKLKQRLEFTESTLIRYSLGTNSRGKKSGRLLLPPAS